MADKSARDTILGALGASFRSETVTVPEWGGVEVVVRELTAAEHDAYQAALINIGSGGKYTVNLGNHRCELLVRSLRDTEGKRLFKDSEVATLGNANSDVIERLHAIAQRVTGVDEAKPEEAEKNG